MSAKSKDFLVEFMAAPVKATQKTNQGPKNCTNPSPYQYQPAISCFLTFIFMHWIGTVLKPGSKYTHRESAQKLLVVGCAVRTHRRPANRHIIVWWRSHEHDRTISRLIRKQRINISVLYLCNMEVSNIGF
jgi:hypothetical protein